MQGGADCKCWLCLGLGMVDVGMVWPQSGLAGWIRGSARGEGGTPAFLCISIPPRISFPKFSGLVIPPKIVVDAVAGVTQGHDHGVVRLPAGLGLQAVLDLEDAVGQDFPPDIVH